MPYNFYDADDNISFKDIAKPYYAGAPHFQVPTLTGSTVHYAPSS